MNLPRIVYAIRHEPTGKVYVGSTSKLPERLSAHFTALKGGYHSNEAMQKDCIEHGFSYSVFALDLISTFQDRSKEYLWIDALGARNPIRGYNAGDRSKEASSLLFDGISISSDDICSVPAIEKLVSKWASKEVPCADVPRPARLPGYRRREPRKNPEKKFCEIYERRVVNNANASKGFDWPEVWQTYRNQIPR